MCENGCLSVGFVIVPILSSVRIIRATDALVIATSECNKTNYALWASTLLAHSIRFVSVASDTARMSLVQQSMFDALCTRSQPPTLWQRLADWIVNARSHRVICIVAGIWILNGFDLALTIMSNEHGMIHEENPIARQVLLMGTPSIALYKIGLVLIGSYPLLRFRSARITEMASMIVLLVYAGLAVRWSTCYEWYYVAFSGSTELLPEHLSSTITMQ